MQRGPAGRWAERARRCLRGGLRVLGVRTAAPPARGAEPSPARADGGLVAGLSPRHPIGPAHGPWVPGAKRGLADKQVLGSDGRRALHGGEERRFPDLLPVHRPICLFQACCYPGHHRQLVDVPFQEYVEHLLEPQDLASLGSGSGSGVPFHWHGPGYSEVIYGRKRWFLYPPEKTPEFHPNKTTLSWLLDTYPFLPPEDRPVECTIRPGEVLYFPDRWWHATLNLDTSVFISTFLG
ncbi:jmjC domain-containing protein 8 isoform X3 [Pelodiscus sinensis]|uniref:jmjC domain-containing protein 8 isoform X3 n=1 Tax=Pelodiscus sinensis TaxID=13735 RepID=UPI003F6AE67B